MGDEKLVMVFMPTLVSTLLRHENEKRSALTKDEVLHIRDNATCVMLPAANAKAVEQNRGYADIDSASCWEQWQVIRVHLHAR
jgi:hypothetical protein